MIFLSFFINSPVILPPNLICNWEYSIFPETCPNSWTVKVFEIFKSPSTFPHISAFFASIDPFKIPFEPTLIF